MSNARNTPDRFRCPEAIRHDAGRDGACRWCGQRNIDVPVLAPRPLTGYPEDTTELGRAYRLHYDPDYGSSRFDGEA